MMHTNPTADEMDDDQGPVGEWPGADLGDLADALQAGKSGWWLDNES